MIFEIYKRGQGKYTRLGTAFGVGLVVVLGCLRFYRILDAGESGLWVTTMVPAGLFVAFGILIFWLVNNATVVDFMVAAESEMKKVSWSSRKEIAVSTFIVIVVVIIMACLLGVTDLVFRLLFSWLLA